MVKIGPTKGTLVFNFSRVFIDAFEAERMTTWKFSVILFFTTDPHKHRNTVYSALNLINGQVIAVKQVNYTNLDKKDRRYGLRRTHYHTKQQTNKHAVNK